MDLEVNNQLLESPLVLWIRTFAGAGAADFIDGVVLNEILNEIDPTFFGMSLTNNLQHLWRRLNHFFQCEKKEYFIEKIRLMDEDTQEELVLYIKEGTAYILSKNHITR